MGQLIYQCTLTRNKCMVICNETECKRIFVIAQKGTSKGNDATNVSYISKPQTTQQNL